MPKIPINFNPSHLTGDTVGTYSAIAPDAYCEPYSTLGSTWPGTVGCIDHRCDQWQAWYKSIPFAVMSDTKTGGRRIHVHEYPSKERWDNEDLGRLRQQFDVRAYVYGDQVNQWAEALFAVCSDYGPGTLYLPSRVPIEVQCITCSSTWTEDEMGRIFFEMRFTIEPDQYTTPGAQLAPTYYQNQVDQAAISVTSSATEVFNNAFTGDFPQVAREGAAQTMTVAARALRTASRSARLPREDVTRLNFEVSRMERSALIYSNLQSTQPNVLSQQASVAAQTSSRIATRPSVSAGRALRASTGQTIPQIGRAVEGFSGAMERSMRILRRATNPGDVGIALSGLARMQPPAAALRTSSQSSAASAQWEKHLAHLVASYVRRIAIAEVCRAGVKSAPHKQPDASLIQARLRRQISLEIEQLADRQSAYDAMKRLQATLTVFVAIWSKGGNATRPVNRQTQGRTLASIVASEFPDEPTSSDRDRQVMAMNGVRHPLAVNTRPVVRTLPRLPTLDTLPTLSTLSTLQTLPTLYVLNDTRNR